MRIKGYIGLFFLCISYWILDSIWSYVSYEYNLKKLIFSEPASYVDTFLLQVPPYQIVSRLMVIGLFVILGIVILEFAIKRQTAIKERLAAHTTLLTVLNSIDATIYVADLQTYEILFMNQFMTDTFGKEYLGRTCHEAFRENSEPCDHCTNDQLIDDAGKPTGVVVWEGLNPITKAWYVNYDRAIQWVDGRIVRLQIAIDITDLKELQDKQQKAETQLRQARKMESIGNLAGGIAHDFNNMLASVLGFTELALDDLPRKSPIADHLREVVSASKRAKDMVRQILAFARQSDEQVQPVEMGSITKEFLKFIRSSIPSTIDIQSHIDCDSWIEGNPTQVHQILLNICTNAAHAMEEEGGVLEVGLHRVAIDEESPLVGAGLLPGDYLSLSISDTGVGIPPDITESIFEPYFTTKAVGEGTGMGLAVVHGIVAGYGGKIKVKSSLGQGTVFTIYLPVTDRRAAAPDSDVCLPPSGAEHILLVDDEDAITRMGRQNLERLGYAVTTSNSSVEALALFRSKPTEYDLVITDMTMPHMTGDRLATELMQIRPDIPVIICTGYSNKISDQKSAELGIKAFAYKPLVKDDLAKTVRRVLDEATDR